jgi:multiple antibiotic resistance protein
MPLVRGSIFSHSVVLSARLLQTKSILPIFTMVSFSLQAFLTLFVVIDPIGLAPIFITLVGQHSPQQQARIAYQAVSVAGAILVAFALGGSFLLRYLDISLEAFQIAGGILLFKIALDMVFAHNERETKEEEQEAQLREDVSIFPLAIPLIAGPGTLASIVISANHAEVYQFGLVVILIIAEIVLAISYTVFRLSRYLSHALGKTGINVVTRVLGVLLSALAVQYIANGSIVLLKGVFI